MNDAAAPVTLQPMDHTAPLTKARLTSLRCSSTARCANQRVSGPS